MHTPEQIANAWMQTYSGGKFHILDPRVEEVHIVDIAHGLSNICRFSGQCEEFYSVAEHSYFVSTLVSPEFALEALLHDSSENFLGDWIRPLKHFTEAGAVYMEIEKTVEGVIAQKFGLPAERSPEVKKADNAMLYAEKAALLKPLDWGFKWAESEEAADVKLMCLMPKHAELKFLERFYSLYKP